MTQALSVALVFALLAMSLWWLRRKGLSRTWTRAKSRRDHPSIEVLDSSRLAPGHAVHLVRVGDRGLLVAAYAGGCTLLEARAWQDFAGGADGAQL